MEQAHVQLEVPQQLDEGELYSNNWLAQKRQHQSPWSAQFESNLTQPLIN